jgi:hypothetical protein
MQGNHFSNALLVKRKYSNLFKSLNGSKKIIENSITYTPPPIPHYQSPYPNPPHILSPFYNHRKWLVDCHLIFSHKEVYNNKQEKTYDIK